jgi:hypothetical protein
MFRLNSLERCREWAPFPRGDAGILIIGCSRLAWKGTISNRYIDAREPPVCTGSRDGIRSGVRVVSHLLTRATRKASEVENRFAEMLKSAARQSISVFLIFFGSLLALNVSVGPCGGTALAVEPFPAIFLSIFGFELIVCSYFLVKNLKVESDFRVVIYLFLGMWSLSLVMAVVMFVKAGSPPAREDIDDFYFSLLRGFAALVNLVLFYRWAGAKKMITRLF